MRRSPTFITYAALVGCAIAIAAVLYFYGGGSVLPGAVGGFAASLLAFMLALSWESDGNGSDRRRPRLRSRAAERPRCVGA